MHEEETVILHEILYKIFAKKHKIVTFSHIIFMNKGSIDDNNYGLHVSVLHTTYN